MLKIPIDFDLSGYAYDPENPTRESEKLCYKLNAVIDEMKVQGFELRAKEAQDITDSEAYIAGVFDNFLTPPETPLAVETPTNEDMLLDDGIYGSINKARTAWLQKIAEKSTEEGGDNLLDSINETLKMMLVQEYTLYLSDGTPIFGKTGLIA